MFQHFLDSLHHPHEMMPLAMGFLLAAEPINYPLPVSAGLIVLSFVLGVVTIFIRRHLEREDRARLAEVQSHEIDALRDEIDALKLRLPPTKG